jgi:hypothetical protein
LWNPSLRKFIRPHQHSANDLDLTEEKPLSKNHRNNGMDIHDVMQPLVSCCHINASILSRFTQGMNPASLNFDFSEPIFVLSDEKFFAQKIPY